MNIQKSLCNISFKKSLKGKCSVCSEKKEDIPCYIYKLEPSKDMDYFKKIKNKGDWDNSKHLDTISMVNNFLKKSSPFSIYTMESKAGDCLGFAEICDFDEEFEISTMETAPKLESHQSDKSKLNYITESFISFFAKLANKKMKLALNIEAEPSSVSFLIKNCNFKNYML